MSDEEQGFIARSPPSYGTGESNHSPPAGFDAEPLTPASSPSSGPSQRLSFVNPEQDDAEAERCRTSTEVMNDIMKIYTQPSANTVEVLRSTLGVTPETYFQMRKTSGLILNQLRTTFSMQDMEVLEFLSHSKVFDVTMNKAEFVLTTHPVDPRSVREEPVKFVDKDGRYAWMFCPLVVNLSFLRAVHSKTVHLHSDWPKGVSPPHGRMLMPHITEKLSPHVEQIVIENTIITQRFVKWLGRSSNVKAVTFSNCFGAESLSFENFQRLEVLRVDIMLMNPGDSIIINLETPNLSPLQDLSVRMNHRAICENFLVKESSLRQVKFPGLSQRRIYRLELIGSPKDWDYVLGLPKDMEPADSSSDEDSSEYQQVAPGILMPEDGSQAEITVLKLNFSLPDNANPRLFWNSSRDVMFTRETMANAHKHMVDELKNMNYNVGNSNELVIQSFLRRLKYDSSIFLPRFALANLQCILKSRRTRVLSLNTGAAVALRLVPYFGVIQKPENGEKPDLYPFSDGYMAIGEMLDSADTNLTAFLVQIEPEADLTSVAFDEAKNGGLFWFPAFSKMVAMGEESENAFENVKTTSKAFNLDVNDFLEDYDRCRSMHNTFTFAFINRGVVTIPASAKKVDTAAHYREIVEEYRKNFQKHLDFVNEGTCGKMTRCLVM